MRGQTGSMEVGNVTIATTENTGLTPEYWAERLTRHVVHVSKDAPLPIRQQAEAFREQVAKAALIYMKHAINSDRSTVAGELERQGHKDMAEIIRRL